ncbi:uncharacterized protein LOC129950489 [Eupeodes corollae]|uniref:uncharacterized protein LOC129950489 n=1 Tax=Eupeodes corollae TaxID=290404 RepID=UPI0024938865|nr:uncharacterized protein LOC129950489 [Eupeodes corollae]
MHHCAFLIITFSCSYILCIQNGGKTVSSSSSSPTESDDNLMKRRHFDSPEARQSFFQENNFDSSGFQPSNELSGFRFPDKHQQYNTNSPNELQPPSSSFGYHQQNYPYLNNNREVANINEGPNPYNSALNTGEHSNNNANNLNNYPYQQHSNAIASFGPSHHRDSPKIPNANDFYLSSKSPPPSPPLYHQNNKNPYYHPASSPTPQYYDYEPIQRKPPTYAQAFGNYLFNGQPNYYNRPRATPPPRPPPPPSHSAFGSQSSYSPYQDGHLTGPYPYDDLTSPSGPSSYPPPQYANQFGNFGSGSGGGGGGYYGTKTPTTSTTTTGSANPLGSLLNSIGGPFAGGNPLSMQIIRGLENIARNDDLQCVPKVLCQMLGSPTRRAQLPSFITSPVLTRFVASLPSFSPALIYGRAALLGLSGGEYSCTRTYNKCPQNEDDILYYLNNHRGGFFKFFSEPDTHQDDAQTQNTQYQYTTERPSYQQQQQSLEPSIFNFLKGLTSPTTSTTTNTNQGNVVNSFMSDAVTNGIGSLFGNIISGFLNGQAAATRRNDEEDDIDVEIDVDEKPKKYSDLIESNSTTTTTTSNSDDDDEGEEKEQEQEVEGRILNNKSNILAYAEPPGQHDNPISFPPENGNDNYEDQQFGSEFRFPNTAHRDTHHDEEDYRRGKKVNFIDSHHHHHPQQDDSYSHGAKKMIFPDRTGTGNLRFDNDEYFRVGKILNRRPPEYNRGYREEQEDYNYRRTTTTTTTTRRPTSYLNRYSSSNYRQDYNQNKYQNKYQDTAEDTSGNVYVTNGQGVIEYYINASGKKIYV